ncbi:hypothetical protein BJ170DRAFT_490526 [Xylariales sp. AK1849]|nr:hypothetical protein BJ170DRAFT_490526 [Xylariales sp. AK1849]
MKSFFVLAVATVIAAQDGGYFPGEPSCAIPCLTSAISKAGCPLSDISCQCGPTQTAIAANVAGCLISNCGAGDLAQAQSAGLAVCSSLSAGKLTITSTAASTGSATESGSMSITRGPSTTGSGSESLTVTESGHTIINETVGGTGTDTVAKVVGGILVGALGIVAAL